MKFVFLNGSPKGNKLSVTMQYAHYLQKTFPEHDYENIALYEKFKNIEKDDALFEELLDLIAGCDGLIWAFPVYIFTVPSLMKSFIELVFENKKEDIFIGKYSTAITSSGLIGDHTAHNYIHAISEDLGMKYMWGYSADMYALLKPVYQQSLRVFFSDVIKATENKEPIPKQFSPVSWKQTEYISPKINRSLKSSEKKVVIVTDHKPGTNLAHMVETYKGCSKYDVKVINLHDISIKGPCLSCYQCAPEGICAYKDDMRSVYEEYIIPADGYISAGTIVDRYFSSRWKLFLDRTHFLQHKLVVRGMKCAGLVSGPLRQNFNFSHLLEMQGDFMRMVPIGIVSDEEEDNETTFQLIQQLAQNMDRKLEIDVEYPQRFLGLGAHKILRDVLYSSYPFLKEDHRYYKENNLYDFPHKDIKTRMTNLFFNMFLSIPAVAKRSQKEGKKYMVQSLQKVVENA